MAMQTDRVFEPMPTHESSDALDVGRLAFAGHTTATCEALRGEDGGGLDQYRQPLRWVDPAEIEDPGFRTRGVQATAVAQVEQVWDDHGFAMNPASSLRRLARCGGVDRGGFTEGSPW